MSPDQQVFKPAEVARLTGLHPNTIRNMVKRGELTNTFAHLDLRRIGIPRSEVESLISPAPVVVASRGSGPAAAVPHGDNSGGSHLRTVDEVAASSVA